MNLGLEQTVIIINPKWSTVDCVTCWHIIRVTLLKVFLHACCWVPVSCNTLVMLFLTELPGRLPIPILQTCVCSFKLHRGFCEWSSQKGASYSTQLSGAQCTNVWIFFIFILAFWTFLVCTVLRAWACVHSPAHLCVISGPRVGADDDPQL